jgi:hypothetical protein
VLVEISALYYVDGLQALLSLGDFELDLVPFMKNLEAFLFNG